jgi:2'-5' RNA ligase
VTLRFIGDANRGDAEDLNGALADISCQPFSLSLTGVDYFGKSKGVRSVWVGVDPSLELNHLQASVESAVSRTGFGPEPRKFKPHITLARFKRTPIRSIAPFLEENLGFSSSAVSIDNFTLYQSHLGKEGAHYEILSDYPLLPRHI